MALSEERKAALIEGARNVQLVTENITEEYKANLLKADRSRIVIPVEPDDNVPCYIFTAKNRIPHCPVLINVHGGGFVVGHMLRDEIFSAKMADAIRGIVVDVDYKVAPEYPYPTAVNEVYGVAGWVYAHAQEWDADPNRICMAGHSAGGTFVSAVCQKASVTGDFKIRLQILDYPCMDLHTDPADKPEGADSKISPEISRMYNEAYTGGNYEVTSEPMCSPGLAGNELLRDLPEALIITAGKDNLRFEDHEYAKRLIENGVRVTAQCFTDSPHGFVIFCDKSWQEAHKLIIEKINSLV